MATPPTLNGKQRISDYKPPNVGDKPYEGQLIPTIQNLLWQTITALSRRADFTVDEAYGLIRTNIPARTAITALTLLVVNRFGDYVHPDPKIQEFIRYDLQHLSGGVAMQPQAFAVPINSAYLQDPQLQSGLNIPGYVDPQPIKTIIAPGTWKSTLASCVLHVYFGYSFHEINVVPQDDGWHLQSLFPIDPNRTYVQGRLGLIEYVVYMGQTLVYLPYMQKILHLVHDQHLTFGGDPYGCGIANSVIPAIKALNLVHSAMVVGANRQAWPLLVGYATDGETQLYDAMGATQYNPDGTQTGVPNAFALATSEQNRVEVLDQSGSGITVLTSAADYLSNLILQAFLIPPTIFGIGGNGSGDSNLNKGHQQVLGQYTLSLKQGIEAALINQVIAPIIRYNFGEQDSYGEFPDAAVDDQDPTSLLATMGNVLATGILGERDLETVNRARDLAGIPPLEDILPIAPDYNAQLEDDGAIPAGAGVEFKPGDPQAGALDPMANMAPEDTQ
jgi:hypothetical protein